MGKPCIALLSFALLLASRGVEAQSPPASSKIAPVDEAAGDPALARLRTGLLRAGRQRDAAQLVPFLADPVVVYGVNRSHDEFLAWFAAQPAADRSRFWDTLRDAFTLGMAYERGLNTPMLLAPYTGVALSALPNGVAEHYAIVGSHVAVHRDPTDSSPVIARLDHDVVAAVPTVATDQPGIGTDLNGWRRIKTRTGTIGWVPSRLARSAYDTRFAIEKRDGVWKISGWATGE